MVNRVDPRQGGLVSFGQLRQVMLERSCPLVEGCGAQEIAGDLQLARVLAFAELFQLAAPRRNRLVHFAKVLFGGGHLRFCLGHDLRRLVRHLRELFTRQLHARIVVEQIELARLRRCIFALSDWRHLRSFAQRIEQTGDLGLQ